MLTLHAELPANRWLPGNLWLADGTRIVAGPWGCRGKADGAMSARAGNPSRDPTLPYGDHPAGEWELTGYVATWERSAGERDAAEDRFGPGFILLHGTGGQAAEAMRKGRSAIGIHAGRQQPDGALVATYGCLRTTTTALLTVAVEYARGRLRRYVCEVRG